MTREQPNEKKQTKNNWFKIIIGVLFLIITYGFIASDISYYSLCKGVKINPDLTVDQLTKLSLVKGLQNSICIYEPVKVGSVVKYEGQKFSNQELFYQGEINLFLFIWKIIAFLCLINMFLLVLVEDMAFDVRKLFEVKQAFYFTSMITAVVILSLYFTLLKGVLF